MKRIIFILVAVLLNSWVATAQFGVTAHYENWAGYPEQAHRGGYYFQWSELVQMDKDAQPEEVILFGRDNGHWPEFDLFKFYVAIVGHYDKKVKYLSDEMVCDKYNMVVEDRDNDGKYEVYVSYIKDGSFSVDERGYYMQAVHCYDRIELLKK